MPRHTSHSWSIPASFNFDLSNILSKKGQYADSHLNSPSYTESQSLNNESGARWNTLFVALTILLQLLRADCPERTSCGQAGQAIRKKFMTEQGAILELIAMLVTEPRTGVLLALLIAAAISDYRSFKIPNLLTGGGILFALVYNSVVRPEFRADWTWAPAGMLLGLIAMLPMYVVRVMGAGDVKLMAMVGAFLGVSATAYAIFFSVVTAGIAALAFAAINRVTARLFVNVRELVRGMVWSAISGGRPNVGAAPIQSVGKLPYGISIAVGTASYLVAQQLGFV